eukprot:1088362-Rhodomonas_salina.2
MCATASVIQSVASSGLSSVDARDAWDEAERGRGHGSSGSSDPKESRGHTASRRGAQHGPCDDECGGATADGDGDGAGVADGRGRGSAGAGDGDDHGVYNGVTMPLMPLPILMTCARRRRACGVDALGVLQLRKQLEQLATSAGSNGQGGGGDGASGDLAERLAAKEEE